MICHKTQPTYNYQPFKEKENSEFKSYLERDGLRQIIPIQDMLHEWHHQD